MKTKFCLFIVTLIITFNSDAQTSTLNDYKYVSVPENFSFLKSKDQYQLNSLTVFLFEKNNFKVLNSLKNYPSDLAQNSCLLLKSDVIRVKGFLKTKLQLVLTDCRDNVVYSSEIGQSKLKDYKKAFQEALRNAFVSVSELNYAYSGSFSPAKPPLPLVVVNETKESKTPKSTSPLVPDPPIVVPSPPLVVPTVNTVEDPEVLSGLIIKSTNSGFDFIDNTTKKVRYSAQATMFENVFIIEGQSGIMYKRGAAWVREYYEQNKTIIETLKILP